MIKKNNQLHKQSVVGRICILLRSLCAVSSVIKWMLETEIGRKQIPENSANIRERKKHD